jgi:HEAT repeat protein
MRALAVVGDREHVAVVRDRLDDPDAEVRRRAARALEEMERRLDL